MTIVLVAFLVIAGLLLVDWLGLQFKPGPFGPFPEKTPRLKTIALPAGLPPPVERFYRSVYGNDVPVIDTVVIKGHAEISPFGVNRMHLQSPQQLDALTGCRDRIGFGEELTGNPTSVAGAVQRFENGRKIQMPSPRVPAIRVCHVKVEDLASASYDACFHMRLLDVHVESVKQKAETITTNPLN